jgi:hypothetical protein
VGDFIIIIRLVRELGNSYNHKGGQKIKMQIKKKKTLFVMIALLGIMSILPFVFADVCSGQNCPADINLTISNIAPTIPEVYPVSAITLNGGTTKVVTIEFNASDTNGYEDLDFATAEVNLSKSGETTRTSSVCSAIANYTEVSTISCDVTMQFYDGAGSDWKITATIEDLATETAINDTTFAVVNALDYVTQDKTYVNWATATLGANDEEADNTIAITNGGNQVYSTFDITGQSATGVTFADVINANKFSVDSDTGQTSGQIYMVSATPVDVTSLLSLNTKGASVTEEIFFYADIPSGIRADSYLSDNAWGIQLG